MSKTHLTERINLWLDKELFHQLEVLAVAGDRTIAAEMRRALRTHVAASSGLTSVEHVALLARQGDDV
jgi:hypothetical protein